jgi:hypothetical protein
MPEDSVRRKPQLVYVVKAKHGGTVAKLIGGEQLDQYVQEYAALSKPEGLTIEVEGDPNGQYTLTLPDMDIDIKIYKATSGEWEATVKFNRGEISAMFSEVGLKTRELAMVYAFNCMIRYSSNVSDVIQEDRKGRLA